MRYGNRSRGYPAGMERHAATTYPAWRAGLPRELAWWRDFLRERALADPGYRRRFDPGMPLQPHLAALLPSAGAAGPPRVLDCAAGPVTGVGKIHGGRALDLAAVDALAGEYAAILAELGLAPPVPSRPGEVERLDALFPAGAFDLVTMTNALDHCHDPLLGLRQMLRAARPGAPVVVEHYRDARDGEYAGLKQWTLDPRARDLVVRNDRHRFSVASALPGASVVADIRSDWMTVVIRMSGT